MEDSKLQGSQPYSFLENLQYSETSNYTYSNQVQLQTHETNSYFPGINQRRSVVSSTENIDSIVNPTELPYWGDKSSRCGGGSYDSKLQENFVLSKDYNSYQDQSRCDREDCFNSQRKAFNQCCPSYTNMNHEYISVQKSKLQNSDLLFDNIALNSCQNSQYERRNNVQSTTAANNYSDNNFFHNINLEEYKEQFCENKDNQYYDDYAGLVAYSGLNANMSNIVSLDTLEQQTEISNDSDIIVEESDEDIINFSGSQQQRLYNSSYKCIICNIGLISVGTQFHYLATDTPITMTSQQPVYNKLISLVGFLKINNDNYICSECLGLINSIDHLQSKLTDFSNELRSKYQNSCIAEGKNCSDRSKQNIRKKSFSCYRCKYCDKMLSIRNYCHDHTLKLKVNHILCHKCGVILKNKSLFNKHNCKLVEVIFRSTSKNFICFSCSKGFRTKTNLKEHQNFCLGILPFICKTQNCNKKFSTSTRLKNHIKLKHEKKFIAICSICNIGFVKFSDYKSHKITHSTDKKFQCKKCEKSYKTQSNLNFHLKSHKISLPHSCNICGKGFMRKEYLETHMNNHSNVKLFVCSKCPKKFASQKNLDSHLKYHEDTIKTKICNICGKSLKSNLNDHLRLHNNLREFECNECEMKFNTKGTLMKHKKMKHKL